MLLVIASIVPLMAFSLGREYLRYRENVDATEERTLTIAGSMSLLIEDKLQTQIATLETLAEGRVLAAGNLDAFRVRAETTAARLFPGGAIELLTKDGREVIDTSLPPGAPVAVRTNLESAQQVFASGQPVVSNVLLEAAASRPVVAVDVPVRAADGSIAYVLSAHPPLEGFADLIRLRNLPSSWLIAVFDRRGAVIARIPNGDRFVGQQAPPWLLSRLTAERAGISEGTSLEGIPLLTAFSHEERFGWTVAIGIAQAELTRPALTAAMRTLAAGGLALAIGLILALYSARRITGPIQSLRHLAATTDRDTWLNPAPTGLREVDEVAQALRAAENERRRSEQAEAVLRLGIQTMPEGFALYDEADCLVMCNESYQRLFPGISGQMEPGKRFEDILRGKLAHYPEAKGHEEEWLAARVREHQEPHTATMEHADDGRWVLITNRRLSNGWLAALRVDITALKAAEQALRDSEERFQQVVERALTAIVMVNSDGRMVLVNALTERIFGYSRAELVGQSVEMLLPERYRNRHPELRAAFFADPQWRPMGAGRELYALRKDGQEFPVEIGLSPLETGDGTMVLAAVVDVTTLKRAEERVNAAQRRSEQALEALKSSNDQLTRAQHVAHIGTNVVDLRTDEREWSDEAYRIFGVSRESFVPSHDNLLTLAHPDDRHLILAARAQLAAGIAPAPMESRIIRPDGSIRHLYREWEIIRNDAGEPVQSLCTIQDVTERHRNEEQLRQAQKMEAIGNLTGGMAHDFNNLLGVIIGNLDLAQTEIKPGGELHELVGEALEAAWRGADLTRRLLAFARRQPLRPADIDINELVTNTLRLLRRLLGEDIEVSLNLAEDIWPVTADPAQLEAALANLANNARDAMPRGGHLIVATANRFLDAEYAVTHPDVTPGDYAIIEVSDTGSGMSTALISKVFEPFFTTKELGKGTGLGLSMAYGFMKQSGGHVNVYSEPGVGTTFRLYLPRAVAEGAAPELSKAALVAASAGETILVVEDNEAMRRVVVRQLRGLGYRVIECEHAAEALELLQREQVDLLLTDIVMPGGLDGVELARLARERWPALKIMLTSGFPEARLNAGGPLLDNLQLLTKPYTNDALASALRAALDG